MSTNQQTLVERLTQRMDLHRIFMFSYPYLEEERQHLLLVVNPVKGLAPKAMAPIVSLCMSDAEDIPFDMVLAGEWQNQLKLGSLYYTYASLPHHELYTASKKTNPLFSHKTITGLLELAALNYEKCRKGSDEFREGVNNFIAKGDLGQAAFMLHQFLELRLKGFQATAGINGGKSHNIEHLMKTVRGVAPQLLTIFPYDSPSVELFRLLDQSYVKAKKQEAIEITQDEFGILLDKCEQAKGVMDGMVAAMVERITAYREQLPPETVKSEETTGAQQASKPTVAAAVPTQLICEDFSGFPWPQQYKVDTNQLLEKIRKNHNPEQITMLNYRTGSFTGGNLFQQDADDEKGGSKVELYLVVLMKNTGPFHFRCMKVGVASAMVVYLNEQYVKKKLAEGGRFVHTLWTKGWVLRKKSTFEPSFAVAEVDWNTEYVRISEVRENAKTCMDNLNAVIQNTANLKLDTGLLLLRNLLEIGVNTYLQCAVGFMPTRLHISELLDWSGIATMKLIDYFHPKSDVEKERLRLAVIPEFVWWQNIPMGLSKTLLSFHRTRAKEIVHFFDGVCGEALEEVARKFESYHESLTTE
ncbi:HEPN domain-containing protein [Parapedobacter tibetensis]|uniref:HEPN domain-containing protein n=1 Tax=Parapedobacter tibetensis TaxID=2972951 RepID=UPI00214D5A60|nr:HEPN domain-containing protein [Parapedobacter tibetensis]